MGTYVTHDDVQKRVPYRTIGAATKPSETDVDAWIDEAEAGLENLLKAHGCTVPVTAASGVKLMRSWVIDYPLSLILSAFAHSAGGDPGSEAGKAEMDRFLARCADIEKEPAKYEAMLTASSTASDSTRVVRCYELDNEDDKSIDDGDFDPEFERGEDWY